jgi:hypothetical protein
MRNREDMEEDPTESDRIGQAERCVGQLSHKSQSLKERKQEKERGGGIEMKGKTEKERERERERESERE